MKFSNIINRVILMMMTDFSNYNLISIFQSVKKEKIDRCSTIAVESRITLCAYNFGTRHFSSNLQQ